MFRMLRVGIGISAAFLIASCVSAGDLSTEMETELARDQLIALERDWIDAEIDKDRAGLERVLDPRFVSTFQSGTTVGRDDYIDIILGMDLAPFTVSGHQIELHGDTALVVDTLDGGDTKFTWVAVKRAGEWKVIAQTFSPKPGAPD